jgi:photosystem II stability/assembly factor-like uncharacterized protein
MKKFGIIAFIFLFTFVNVANVFAATWTEQTGSGSRGWFDIASSSDGTKLAAIVQGGSLYTSTDSGVTWGTQGNSAGSRYWQSITSSSDGTKLAAANYLNGYLYTSADSGATWTERTGAGQRYWQEITSSSDGTKLAAVASGYIYTSTDSGATWSTQSNSSGSKDWLRINSSADGTKLAAAVSGGYIYTSADSGASWTEQTNSGSRNWYGVTISSDGTKLSAINRSNGYLYTSTDSGATWTERTSAGQRNWTYLTASSDGTKLAAIYQTVSQDGYIYTSTDSGASWTQETSAGPRGWQGLNITPDGANLAASVNGGYIYTATVDSTAPTITSVSSDKTNGTYGVGEVIDIDVTFSEAVTSTGNVTVTLETGDTDRTCTFTVSNGTTGTCNYTVQSGDTSADLTVSSISGTIADQSANAMSSFVPATNLAANKDLVIDTVVPTASGATGQSTEINASCSISDTTIKTGDEIDIEMDIEVIAGGSSAPYSFKWIKILTGSDKETSHTFDTEGEYIIKGQVKTDYADKTITCDTVTVSGESSTNSNTSNDDSDEDEDTNTEETDTETTTTTSDSFTSIISKYKDFLLTLRSVGVVFSPEVESVLNGNSSSTNTSETTSLTETETSTSVRDLEHGMRGDDVKSLQELLISQGYSIPAGPTGYFVDQTRDALIEYQIKNSITPAVGYFGEATRTQMKSAGLGVWW